MAITKGNLPLSTTPLAITAQTDCSLILVKEDPTVLNWPTTVLNKRVPNSNSDVIQYGKGGAVPFQAPSGVKFAAGTIVGYVDLPSSTTTGVQEEM